VKTLNLLLFTISILAITVLYLDLTGTISIFKDMVNNYALFVGLLIPLSLLFLGYVQLRNMKTYILWLLLGAGMLLFYYQFREADVLQMKRGTALNSFKSLFAFLIVFQLCRAVFIKMTGREYVTPSIGGSNDLFEDKKPQLADFIMFGLLFFTIIAAKGV
jgi:purine-cytosine permease-like protein